jgi:hypothetical protein
MMCVALEAVLSHAHPSRLLPALLHKTRQASPEFYRKLSFRVLSNDVLLYPMVLLCRHYKLYQIVLL